MYLFIAVVISQRLIEMRIARQHAQWIKSQGGYERGEEHYPYIVTMHILFFVALLTEVTFTWTEQSQWSMIPLMIFLLTQWGRVWVLSSLGRFWNTRIMILPGAKIVAKGPYRFVRHPNYLIVAIEIVVLPLIFHAYWTAAVFTLFNATLMVIRIKEEERALKEVTDYDDVFVRRTWFKSRT